MNNPSVKWRQTPLEDLTDLYFEQIHPEFTADDTITRPYPTYDWLVEHGYRGLEDGVRQHGLTLKEFFTDIAELAEPSTDYNWDIDHPETQETITEYIASRRRRGGLAESTLASKRSRLTRYAQEYQSVHGTSNILTPAKDMDEAEAFRKALEVFDVLDEELETGSTKIGYYSDIRQFYNHLIRWRRVTHNPVTGVLEEFGWEKTEYDNKGLTAQDVRTLLTEASKNKDRLIVLALCGWGLRPNEVAALHQSQFNELEDRLESDPYIEFDDNRKNGPGTVTVLYGADAVRTHITRLEEVSENWNGYLFPSSQSQTGHITTRTVQNWFRGIAEAADVTVDSAYATPKTGRRFWYTTYQEVMRQVYEQLDTVAEEQGSASAQVVAENYTSEEQRRRMRRDAMQQALARAFDGVF